MADGAKYIVLTIEDAAALGLLLDENIANGRDPYSPLLRRIRLRLQSDAGADIQDIVDRLKEHDHCAACHIEGQAQDCVGARSVQRLGRRLRRLLERARGERAPGNHSEE